MEKDKITVEILNAVSTIVGIVGFADLNFIKNDNNLSYTENSNIIITKINNQLNISIGIIILSNVSAKGIIEKTYQIINYTLQKYKLTIGYLDVFIRGIQ